MQSRVLKSIFSNASSFVVRARSIGQDVPKAAAAPSGLRLTRESANASRSRSLQSPCMYEQSQCPQDVTIAGW
ncbi:MAG: hypothetical protein CM1200mP30_23420 [Pseudomonadota bacterium]|nr:MAG: hypothetical protein CM1200mP30_23420 [Pseudomonadota bacterium]